jgi:DNA-binding NarL/FixJ family response regulator
MSSLDNQLIRTLLIDDHAVVRTGLRLLLETRSGLKVIGEAGNSADALVIASREQPDIIILDLLVGAENGLDFLPDLLAASKNSRVIILTGLNDPKLQRRALQLGAMGIVLKDKAPEILLNAIEKVYAGEAWIDSVTIAMVLTELSHHGNKEKKNSQATNIDNLTKRERDILMAVTQGLKNRQIAERLFISEVTVRHHLTSIFSKLHVSDRYELLVYAYKKGICDFSNR